MRVTAAVLSDPSVRCVGCGLALHDILAARRAGCDRCYRTFARALDPLRPRARGPAESAAAARWRRWRALEAALAEAVLVEDFERAAKLKQSIVRLRQAPPR